MNTEILQTLSDAERDAERAVTARLRVCTGTACAAQNSAGILDALRAQVVKQGCHRACAVSSVGCPGLCAIGPLVAVDSRDAAGNLKDQALYQGVQADDAMEIVAAVVDGTPLPRLRCDTERPFFKRQHKIVLENCGRVDPDRIESAIAHGGYRALAKALAEMTPAQVIDAITRSGLRGRGGAGFPTGVKWATVANAAQADPAMPNGGGSERYVICNGDEGDPGAFMDRSVMEGDPHRVIEGMLIAGYAVGATQGYVYVRAEYPLAVTRLRAAIRHAERHGLLGRNICGSAFSFAIDVRLGAGAFVCGEETALMASIEGRRGTPRPRPPFPAESGLWGRPTLINNVETFANIAPIIAHGAEWFASIGTASSKGTKVFALVGQVANVGLIEVPMGITLREIVYDIGGGVPNGRTFKAVQTGGPSGGCVPATMLDMPVDYESLAQAGTIMGSGGMIVMDDSTDMIDIARYYMAFCMDESCGKCTPCRVGTVQMYRLLSKFAAGAATRADLDRLEGLCDLVHHTSLCGLGQTAPNPVLSTLRYFREEYESRCR
jgi:bidirectional [NiFe] hydrogenase diaphorase subunit